MQIAKAFQNLWCWCPFKELQAKLQAM
jgi:hypothetical protein